MTIALAPNKQHDIFIGVTDRGTYIAASASSPYFCFEGETEEGVTDTACRALSHFFSLQVADTPIRVQVNRETQLTRVFKRKREVFSVDDCVAA